MSHTPKQSENAFFWMSISMLACKIEFSNEKIPSQKILMCLTHITSSHDLCALTLMAQDFKNEINFTSNKSWIKNNILAKIVNASG